MLGCLAEQVVDPAQLKEDSKAVDIALMRQPERDLGDRPGPDVGPGFQKGGHGIGAKESVQAYPSA